MRNALASRCGQRSTYTATVDRFGSKPAYRGDPIPTVLLRDVTDLDGQIVTDHLWLTAGVTIRRLNLQVGDRVRFDGRVTAYTKGYMGRREVYDRPVETDYRLSHPTKIERLEEVAE